MPELFLSSHFRYPAFCRLFKVLSSFSEAKFPHGFKLLSVQTDQEARCENAQGVCEQISEHRINSYFWKFDSHCLWFSSRKPFWCCTCTKLPFLISFTLWHSADAGTLLKNKIKISYSKLGQIPYPHVSFYSSLRCSVCSYFGRSINFPKAWRHTFLDSLHFKNKVWMTYFSNFQWKVSIMGKRQQAHVLKLMSIENLICRVWLLGKQLTASLQNVPISCSHQ